MVGVLRDGDGARPRPAARRGRHRAAGRAASADRPRVDVQLSGDLDDARAVGRGCPLPDRPGVGHQRASGTPATPPGSTCAVVGDDDCVRLTVARRRRRRRRPAGTRPGYGLVGMAERASLLGGTLEAGPSPDRGWTVDAVLPRSGSPADMTIRVLVADDQDIVRTGLQDDPRRPARHRGRRRGRRRPRGGGARPPAAPRRLPVRHPHARAWTASRPPASSPGPTSTTRWRSSSSPPSTSTSTCTAR